MELWKSTKNEWMNFIEIYYIKAENKFPTEFGLSSMEIDTSMKILQNTDS